MTKTNDDKNVMEGASAQAIQSHYDVSNKFYQIWLDPEMNYSCALFPPDCQDLEVAQIAKLDWHAATVAAGSGSKILDIGCGWGAMARRLLENYGVAEVEGLTLSQTQFDWIANVRSTGFRAHLCPWEKASFESPFTGIISIGAFEHFVRLGLSPDEKLNAYRRFFLQCADWLEDGGCLSLQSIIYSASQESNFSAFFENEIFPESNLPHLDEIFRASRGLFVPMEVRLDGEHYAKTARKWLSALKSNRDLAVTVSDEETVNRFIKYLSLLAIGFDRGQMSLTRIAFKKIPQPIGAKL